MKITPPFEIPEQTLVKQIVKCPLCGSVIESKHHYHFISCECEAISIDGGTNYCRWLWDETRLNSSDIIDQCVYEIRARPVSEITEEHILEWLMENNFPRKYNQWNEEQKMLHKLTWG